jgi:hypothetical protein
MKLKLITAVLLLSLAAFAAPATTTVSDTLYDQNGQLASGTIIIRNPLTFTSADGFVITQGTSITATITNGVFSVALVPNAGSNPSGTTYTAEIQLTAGGFWRETWIVPSSGTPVALIGVRTTSPPATTLMFSMSQLNPPSPCTAYQVARWNGQSWECGATAVMTATGQDSVAWYPGFFYGAYPTLSAQIVSGTNQIRFAIFFLPYRTTVRKMTYQITTLGTAGSKFNSAIYSKAVGSTTITKVVETGALAADVGLNVVTTANVTATTLEAGLYVEVWTCTDTNLRMSGYALTNASTVTSAAATRMGIVNETSSNAVLANTLTIPTSGTTNVSVIDGQWEP